MENFRELINLLAQKSKRVSGVVVLILMGWLGCGNAFANGGGVDGATLWEQIMQEATSLNTDATEALHYEQAVIQTEQFILMLEKNPLGAIFPNIQALISGANTIVADAKQIDAGIGKVGTNFMNNIKNAPANSPFGVNIGIRENAAFGQLQKSWQASTASITQDAGPNSPASTSLTNVMKSWSIANGTMGAEQANGTIMTESLKEHQLMRTLAQNHYMAQDTVSMVDMQNRQDDVTVLGNLFGVSVAMGGSAPPPLPPLNVGFGGTATTPATTSTSADPLCIGC
jgi:hypothetical protein